MNNQLYSTGEKCPKVVNQHQRDIYSLNSTKIYLQSELHRETHNLLHSESDLDEENSFHLSRKRSQSTSCCINASQIAQILWSIFLWNHWLFKLLIESGKRIQLHLDQMMLFGLGNLIHENKSSLWSIKCLGTLPILMLLAVFRTIFEVAMLLISLHLWFNNDIELRLRRLF